MKKAKVRGIAALFTALFALMLAAFLCMNVPARDVRAADETETSGTSHSVDNETELLTLFAGGTLKAGDTILLTNSIELDMREGGNVASESQAFGGHLALVVDVTIDLGDNTLTVKTGAPQSVEDQEVASCAINVGQYQKQSIPTDITVKNGKLVGESYGNFVTVQSGSSLSLENVKVSFECTAPETAAVDTPAAIGTVDKASLYLNDVTFSSLTNAVPLMAGVSDPEDGSADISSVSCGTLQDYINISSDTYRVVYSIDQDVDGSLVIPDYANFTLDLNGKTVTNTDGEHTITNYGTLTIVDNSADKTGTVDNVTHARTALVNYGTAILNGGTFTRSQETGTYEPYSGNENSYYTIENFGILTVDGATVTTRTVDGDGKAVGGFSSLVISVSNENATISGDPSVTIRSGRLTGGANTVKINSGTLSIKGGELVNYTQNVVLTYGSNATITGGTLTLENPVRNDGGNCAIVYASSDEDVTEDSGTVTIDGGTFKVVGTAENAVISGVRAVANADVTVNDVALKTAEGGSFDNDVLTEGSAQVSVSSTADLNEPAGAVASIETDGAITYFTTLEAAFDAAMKAGGGTVTLLAKYTLAEQIRLGNSEGTSVPANTIEITFDLNGNTLTLPEFGDDADHTRCAIYIYEGYHLTLVDSGTDGAIDASQNGVQYTVPIGAWGGTFEMISGAIVVDTEWESCVFSYNGGGIEISGGKLENKADTYARGGGAPLTVNVSNSGSYEDVTITGGTFIGRNPAQGDDNMGGYFIDENAAVGYDADGYNGTGEFTVYESEQAAIDAGADAVYTVANSGSAEAATVVTVYTAAGLADALAGTYSVIRLGADLKLSESIVIDRALTLDLNGNTITYSGSAGTYAVEIRADGAMLTGSNGSAIVAEYGNGILVQLSISGEEGVTINGISVTANADGARGIQATGAGSVTLSGVSVTVKGAVGSLSAGVGISNGANMEITDGSIIYLTGAGNAVEVRSQEGGVSSLVVQNSTIDTAWQGIAVFGMYASGNAVPEEVDNTYTVVKVEGTTIKVAPTSSSYYAIAGNGEAHGTDITVTDSTLTSYYAAIFQPQNGILTLTGNTTLTGGAGIEVRSGTLNINDENVTIEANRSFYTVPGNYRSGTTVIGAAIVISQHSTNLPVNVNISEGTYRAVGDAASNGYAFYEVDFEETQTATDQIKTSITGGTFTGDIYSENVTRFITGGTFDTAFSEDYLGSSRYLYTSGTGYGVGTQNDAYNANIYIYVGQRGFASLQEAIDSIPDDDYESEVSIEFRTPKDVSHKFNDGETATIKNGQNIRLYPRNDRVTLLGSIVVEKGGRLEIFNSSGYIGEEGNLVTITNSGTVYFNAGTRYVNVENYGELTIASGTYQGGKITNYGKMAAAGAADPVFNGTQFIANDGTATFERGKFDESVTFTENGGEISLQGGSYKEALTNANGQNIAQYVPATHEFTLSATENMVSIIKTAAATVQVKMSDGTIYRFTVFSTAVAKADDGATITLLDDISYSVNKTIEIVNKSLTFDLGGHTISTTGTSCPNYMFDISVGNATIIFRNGTIDVRKSAIKLHSGAANAGADGELILESTLTVEVTGDYSERNAVFVFAEVGNTVSLTSYATLSSGSSATIMGNGDEFGTLNIDILGGSVTSDKTVAMYLPQATCTTTIANAAITGTTGIEIRNGTLVISGDTTVTATGDFSTNAPPSVGGNTVLGGAAIAVSKYDIANTSLSVTIDGGTFTAENGRAFYEGNHNPNRDDSYDGVEGTYEFANGAPVVSITGGTFNGEVEAKNITKFISGGSYTKSFNNDYLAAGYALEGSEGNYTVEVNAAAVYNDTAYETLQAAIDAAGENAATITLLQNVTENVTIGAEQNITLDLNGCTITNNGSYAINNAGTLVIVDNAGDGSSANMIASNFDTIYNTGTLTVGKNVYVDALSHGKAAVYNEVGGTFTLDGGRLARSKENGISSSNNGGNSFYVLLNHGTATLNGIIQQPGGYSSLIENGWQDGNDNTQQTPSVMTITGGEYSGGLNTVKNDDYGQLTITGGTFSNISQAAVMNWNVAEINGGTFEINEGAFAVVVNGYLNNTMDQGKLTITGGTFTGGTIIMQNSYAADIGEVAVSGGTFGEPVPEDYLDRNGTDNPLYALQYNSETDAYTLVENSEPQAMIIDASDVSYRYATLVNALEAAQNGDTVVLLADIGNAEEYASVFLTLDRDIQLTFDLGGHTIYADATDSSTGAFFTITQGSLTVDNGQIYVIGSDTYNAETGDGFRVTPEGEGAVARLTLGSGLSVTSQYANAVYIGKAGSAYAGDVFNAYLTTEANLTANGRYAAIQGNGTKHGTSIVINGGTITSKGAAIYHPQYGQLTINGGTITGTTGIELRAGTLTIKGGEIIATGDFDEQVNGNGGTLNGVAIGISQHTTELPISVNITAGTFNATGADGKAFLEIDTVEKEDVTPSEGVVISIVGGKFNAPVEARNITGFISGGQYAELPAEGLFAEGYEGAFYGATGYYEVIESVSDDLAALLTAQANAQADVRGALAAYGWTMAYVEQLAAQEGEALLKANAAALVAAYADITEATSEYSVAQARLAAINALDGLLAEFDGMKAAAAGEIAAAAEAKEEADGQPAQEAVVVPTATYNAIYAARNKAELESLLENALAEIADIRSYRAQIAAQSTQLDEIEKAVGELNNGLFTDNTGAIDSILNTVEAAREQITGVAADADAASLAELNEYLTKTIQGSLDTINTLLNAFAEKLLGAYNKADGTFAGNGTLDTLLGYFEGDSDIFDAITQAKNEIMGAANGEGGMSISDLSDSLANVIVAFEENGTIAGLQNDLTAVKEALLGTSGIDDRIDSILDKIDSVIGTNGTTLDSILSAVGNANTAIGDVKTLLDSWSSSIGLLGSMNTTLTNAAADIGDLTGALLDASGGLSSSITEAIADIESIRQSIASLADGDDVTAITGDLTDILADIAALQTTVDSIANSVSASTAVEEAKDNAMTDLRDWLNDYLDSLLGADSAQAGILVARAAYTPETTDGDIYARLTQAFSEDNANLVLRYYNEALAAIDAATTISDVTTAVSTFRAQVASVEASAQNTPSLTGVYVLLAVVLVLIVVACVAMLLKGRREVAAQTQAQPETQPEESAPAAAAQPEEVAEEPAAPAEEPAAPAEELAAEEDGDKEHIVIAANVRSFSEAYMDLTDEQRDLFNKVREYALAKEGAVEVKQSGGVVVKREGKQVVKLTVRRDMPVALFLLENEMLKTFRRNAKSEAKLKVRATELVIRDEDDLETAYTMVDLSVDQIEKDIEAAKERRKELRRQRRLERQAQQAAAQAESAAAQAPADGTAAETPAADAGEGSEE